MPHQRDGAPSALGDALQSALEPQQRAVRTIDIDADPRPVRAMTHPPQPVSHHGQRRVPSQDSRDQQHGTAVAAHDALSAENRVHQQPYQLRLPAQLMYMTPPPTPVTVQDQSPAWLRGSVPLGSGRLRHRPSVVSNADNTETATNPRTTV